jgi:hypothetical protein
MNNYYSYKAALGPKKTNYMICFYSGGNFNFSDFLNEMETQFKDAIFTKEIVFITPGFNKNNIKNKLLGFTTQEKLKDKINSFQKLVFHTCFIKRDGLFDIDVVNDNEKKLSDAQVSTLIEAGLFNVIKKRNLILEARSDFHYIKPSGKHTCKFIDVKNILESSAEITFITICLLKLLPEKITKIYVDTSGIYPIAYDIVNILNEFDKQLGKQSELISIDSFGSYGGLDEYKFSSDDNTLILISASTSNKLYKILKNMNPLSQTPIVSIVMTQVNQGQDVLVDFNYYKDKFCNSYFAHFESYDEKECPMCLKEHSIPLALDKSRFVFDAPRTETYLPLSKDSDKELRRMIHDYHEMDVFRCLFDGVDGKTKMPAPEYFIDLSKIIKDVNEQLKVEVEGKYINKFQYKLKNKIIRHFPLNTDCILHCKDQGARELAELIQLFVSELGLKINLYEGELPEGFVPKKGIVVVAGSIESGKSLLNISRDLRHFNYVPLSYIVGFAKFNSAQEFKKLEMDLKFTEADFGFHQFHVIEKILLPINETKEHSWKKELYILNKLTVKYKNEQSLLTIIELREQQLKNATSADVKGLGEKLYIPSPKGEHLVLGKTFAFWDKADNNKTFNHQATVYFTISSVLQNLRTTPDKNGIIPLGEGYVIRQLDPLLFDRFNEGVIQASILRSAKPKELDYSASDTKSQIVGTLIERMLEHPEVMNQQDYRSFYLLFVQKNYK